MMTGAHRDIPRFGFNISGIDRLLQKTADCHWAKLAVRQIFWKVRFALQKTLHFDLRFEPAAGKSFERFANNGGKRFVKYQLFATTRGLLIAIADRRTVDPETLLHPGFHFLMHLPRILFAFKSSGGSENCLQKLAFRGVFKIEIETDTNGIALHHLAAK
nr:hypothetical protein [Roseibium aggregatum]